MRYCRVSCKGFVVIQIVYVLEGHSVLLDPRTLLPLLPPVTHRIHNHHPAQLQRHRPPRPQILPHLPPLQLQLQLPVLRHKLPARRLPLEPTSAPRRHRRLVPPQIFNQHLQPLLLYDYVRQEYQGQEGQGLLVGASAQGANVYFGDILCGVSAVAGVELQAVF